MRQNHRRIASTCLAGVVAAVFFGGWAARLHADDKGGNGLRVSTKNEEARAAFNEGRLQLFGFNHDEAIRAFRKAAALDPDFAMAYWGVATALGPHINNPVVSPEKSKDAMEALKAARERIASCSPIEKALIEAASHRWTEPPPKDRMPLDRAYADAMKRVWQQFPSEPDVGAMYAESLMNLRPWDLWDLDGKPRPETPAVTEALEAVFRLEANHPLALHLYIHAVEASPNPGRADDAADRLRKLNLGYGHLVHMPAHIDLRLGRWQMSIEANEKAIAVDRRYVERQKDQRFYRIYMAHNRHMLAFAAMMQGESKRALESIRTMLAEIPEEWLKDDQAAGFADGLFAMPIEVMIRFGKWDEALTEPEPRERFPVARALWRASRGVALAAKGNVDEARKEQAAFRKLKDGLPESALVGNNPAPAVIAIADDLLEGEIAIREGKLEEGFRSLRAGVNKEDALKYDEPPDWVHPVRHALGAALMKVGKAAEAEAVYREDLKKWPNNGWSLYGLADSLRRQGKTKEADVVQKAFEETWKRADVKLKASCFCQSGE